MSECSQQENRIHMASSDGAEGPPPSEDEIVMTVKHRVEREGERETQPRGERRRVPLTVAFASGFITCVVLCLQYYSKGGCSAAREIGRRENARQVSDLMCCPAGKLIGTC